MTCEAGGTVDCLQVSFLIFTDCRARAILVRQVGPLSKAAGEVQVKVDQLHEEWVSFTDSSV